MGTGKLEEIVNLLPGYNCGICGFQRCEDFAKAVIKQGLDIQRCRFLDTDKLHELKKLVEEKPEIEKEIVGLIDNYTADFVLEPLKNEKSCREILYPFSDVKLKEGDIIRYRPLGCPITHFAEILEEENGLITVHIVGPKHRLGDKNFKFKDIGLCLVLGFIGRVNGKIPKVGKTVRFIPKHCMMQKVHSGVVVEMEGRKAKIESIDLKVWRPL